MKTDDIQTNIHHFVSLALFLCWSLFRVAWLLWDQFILELMCLDSELISEFTCVISTSHVHKRLPEIWQHPDQRERPANDQCLDWSVCESLCVCVRVCVCRGCVLSIKTRGGDPRLRTEQLGPSSYPRGVWGPTPVLLPHVRGMRRLKSAVWAHVCLNRTQLQPACICVCEKEWIWRRVSDEVSPSPQRPTTCVPVSCVYNEVHRGCVASLIPPLRSSLSL